MIISSKQLTHFSIHALDDKVGGIRDILFDDETFTVRLFREAGVKVLPGSFLSRETDAGCPGKNRVRIALVATESECSEAAQRIVDSWGLLSC